MNPSPLRWLTEERDACGVGFLADRLGRATYKLVQQTLTALECMEHRGGCGSDSDSGDGAGIMTAIPWELFQEWAAISEIELPDTTQMAVGMLFLPQDGEQRGTVQATVESYIAQSQFTMVGWREVPTRPEVLGTVARQNQPFICQLVIAHPSLCGTDLEHELFALRRRLDKQVAADCGENQFYAASFSSRTLVYKGMVRSSVLGQFYLDLQSPLFISPFATYHRRFSTNTYPRWPLAQPMRYLGHNGEINTYLGNANWLAARESTLSAPQLDTIVEDIKPIVNSPDSSDSGALDNTFELMVQAGYDPTEAIAVLVPEAYRNQPELESYPEVTDFYEFYSGLQEPWDGPALIVFSDGNTVGATLDRNGLRPARYVITHDGLILVGSEAGVLDIAEERIVEKGRLGPGQMLAVDLSQNAVLKNWDIKQQIASKHTYGKWLADNRVELESGDFAAKAELSEQHLVQMQTAFGFSLEDVEMIVESMAEQGKEPTFCMGDDTPLAVLSTKPHPFYDYFKQRFAQVTNPAIDPLRESLVMSLDTYIGKRGNLLAPQSSDARLLSLKSPVINEAELSQLSAAGFKSTILPILFTISDGPAGLEKAVRSLCDRAAEAVRSGTEILHLSDRNLDADHAFIPPLLAVGAIHHHLIKEGLRLQASIVVETAQCWSTHHFACLIGYGASAVCPYLAFETVRQWWSKPKTQTQMSEGKLEKQTVEEVQLKFRAAVELGLLKILSKMGISLLSSYQGAQIFEAIGLSGELVNLAFCGTVSRVGGLTLKDLAQEAIGFHARAFPELLGSKLENFGFIQSRRKGEHHINSPIMAKQLHKALESENPDFYEIYRASIAGRPPTTLRDLLEFNSDRPSISIDEVEPVEDIFRRFATGGMSLGALSREAHETLAIGMNRIGGKSNSGEGGEDPARFVEIQDVTADGKSALFPHLNGLKVGDSLSSAIKQVASGRFGVTPEYLLSAKQIEIKLAQGAKPGEGGQLPGHKVSSYIAGLRRSKPGVSLISPPPHHDIYSIEDLAQLIFDLHQINPKAKVSVKLVAEIGIGTIAAGVAKANADIIQISGHDGGTGASPLSSIKHAGSPWELGLTEVHRALMENGLRDRSLLRVDGGIRTGWEVVMAAMMGAEEFGFGTVAMIAVGCIMARVCHTNQCPVGVATQQERLRQRFSGAPEDVVTFFSFVADEVRQILATLGYRSIDEIVGRSDLLTARTDVQLTKVQKLDLSCLLELPDARTDRSWLDHEDVHSNGAVLDNDLLHNPKLEAAISQIGQVRVHADIRNTDRTVGARIAGRIAKKYGNDNFAKKGGRIHLDFSGSAGQSFGAYTLPGMALTLVGEANDYVGKGMNGGEIVIKPPVSSHRPPHENVILGNTCLYGATGGTLFASGVAGERFAVRNSLGQAVIEGAGDHCCEYMTGGRVVVLGKVGRNVGAGMTGGIAYLLDEEGNLPSKVNGEIVRIQRIQTPAAEDELRKFIKQHAERTGSPRAALILERWDEYLPKFWQVIPPSEDNSELTHVQSEAAVVAPSAS